MSQRVIVLDEAEEELIEAQKQFDGKSCLSLFGLPF